MKEVIMQQTEEMTTFGSVWKRFEPVKELIRCKDCKHGEPCKNGLGEDAIECFDSDICLEVRCRRPNWFCANGELKE